MMTNIEMFLGGWRNRLIRFRRRLPYLVWYGQRVQVRVTFKENRLEQVEFESVQLAFGSALAQLNNGALPKIERGLDEIGVKFDTGLGPHGREWEWDWSLAGPIEVTFTGAWRKG